MREGGKNCLKNLKRGSKKKERRENKDFKNRGSTGSRNVYLKNGGCNPLANYVVPYSFGKNYFGDFGLRKYCNREFIIKLHKNICIKFV